MHYYQHHIGDFIRDTSRLTDSQCMAYMRMLWMYYESEEPIPNNIRSIAFKIGAEQEVVELILDAYFRLDGDVWRHTRCDKEIAEYKAICDRNKTNGKAGGRPKKTQSVSSGNQHDSDAEPCRNPNHEPITNNQEPFVNAAPKGAAKGRRLDSEWVLPKTWGDWVVEELGWSEDQVRFEADKFKDFWISKAGKDAAKLDWMATWRNWCRNAKVQPEKQTSSLLLGGI